MKGERSRRRLELNATGGGRGVRRPISSYDVVGQKKDFFIRLIDGQIDILVYVWQDDLNRWSFQETVEKMVIIERKKRREK